MADGRSGGQSRRNGPVAVERAQSPDHEEAPRSRPDSDIVMIPSPDLLNIEPVADTPERTATHGLRHDQAHGLAAPSRSGRAGLAQNKS